MGKSTNNISNTTQGILSSFMKLKFVTLSCIVGMVLTACICVVYSTNKIAQLGGKIYVLDNGQVLTASQQDAQITRPDEVKAQSERFHKFLFNIPPNSDIVRKNVESALEISDKSVYDYYYLLREKGVYKKLFDAGATQWIEIDSVSVRPGVYPYQVQTYATIWTMRPSNMSKSTFLSECRMVDVTRNEKNLNGLKIENFVVRSNEIIETRKR